MATKQLTPVIGAALVCMHLMAIIKDVERYKLNLGKFVAAPTLRSFASLLVAEGVLIRDLD